MVKWAIPALTGGIEVLDSLHGERSAGEAPVTWTPFSTGDGAHAVYLTPMAGLDLTVYLARHAGLVARREGAVMTATLRGVTVRKKGRSRQLTAAMELARRARWR